MLSTSGGSSVMAREIVWRMQQRGFGVASCHCAAGAPASDGVTPLSRENSFHIQRSLDTDRCFVGGLDVCSQVLEWHRAARFDLLHVHALPVFGLPAFHLKRLRGVPYVVTLHGSDVLSEQIAHHNREMIGGLLAEAAAVTCVSEHLAHALAELFPALPRATVVHNFLRHEFDGAHDTGDRPRQRYLHVSSLRPVKRPELLAEAFRLVQTECADARLRIVTTRQGMIRARDLMDSTGPSPAVELLEGDDGVRPLLESYAGAATLVLTSRFESFGLVLLEALAHGLAVVAPAIGGVTEVLGEDWPLLVRDVGEPRAYARAMLAAAEPTIAERLRPRALEILARFDPSRQIDRYLEIYDRALRPPT